MAAFGAMMFSAAFIGDTTPSGVRPIIVGMGVSTVALALFGLWNGVSLLRLRPWARTSAMVLGGLMAVFATLSLLIVPFIPAPQGSTFNADGWRIVRVVMIAIYAIPLGVGIWWLVYFNRASTKAAFAAGADGLVESARPLSISIMAWASIVAGVFTPFAVLVPLPAFLFGIVFTGLAAKAVYIGLGALSIYMGWALLRLREHGRLLALGWCAFIVVHGAVMILVPSARAHLRDVRIPGQPVTMSPDQMPMMAVMFVGTLAMTAIAVWYLVRAKPAFTAGRLAD